MQLLAAIEVRRFEADGAQQQVDPFIGGEVVAARPVLFKIEGRKLDRFQAVNPERAALALLLFVVLVRMSTCAQIPPISSRSYSRR